MVGDLGGEAVQQKIESVRNRLVEAKNLTESLQYRTEEERSLWGVFSHEKEFYLSIDTFRQLYEDFLISTPRSNGAIPVIYKIFSTIFEMCYVEKVKPKDLMKDDFRAGAIKQFLNVIENHLIEMKKNMHLLIEDRDRTYALKMASEN